MASRLLFYVSVLIVQICAQSPPARKIVKQFQASATFKDADDLAGVALGGNGSFSYYQNNAYRLKRQAPSYLFNNTTPDIYYVDTLQYTKMKTGRQMEYTMGALLDPVCRVPNGVSFIDFFYWFDSSKLSGTQNYTNNGTNYTCDMFSHSDKYASTYSVCVKNSSDGKYYVPVIYWQTQPANVLTNINFTMSLTGWNFSLDTEWFKSSDVCVNYSSNAYAAPKCVVNPLSPSSTTIDIYRVHGQKEPLELYNRDAGDALGDVSFLCQQLPRTAEAIYGNKLVSLWKVKVDTSFGQYGLCNYQFNPKTNDKENICIGGDTQAVGKQSSLGLGHQPMEGQCSDNSDVGTFYSFPALRNCTTLDNFGVNGCTWIATRVKTIEMDCVMNKYQLLAYCDEERGSAPFTKASNELVAAIDETKCTEVFPQS